MSDTHALFTYGTLMCPDIFALVCGRQVESCEAFVLGYQRFRIIDQLYPAMVSSTGGRVEGRLYPGLTSQELALLDEYEGDWYQRIGLDVCAEGGSVHAYGYILLPQHSAYLINEDWDFDVFNARDKKHYLQLL